jgi:hypothetical protein
LKRFQPGDDVGELPDLFLVLPVHQFNRARVQTRACELAEILFLQDAVRGKFHARQINFDFISALQYFPRALNAQRNFQFTREDIHRAKRQHAKPRAGKTIRRIADSVQNFIDRTVAASGRDQIKSVLHGLPREPARVARRSGGLECALRADGVQLPAKPARFFAVRRRIEDHAR